jgi:hypothetical protein
MTTISWLRMKKEIIAVYSEDHMKPIKAFCEENAKLLNVKAGGP